MSPVALSLNLLLAMLLLAALAIGWRLDRRLKALRDSHAGFAGAVADLDRAAERAQAGLAQLRTATDEALELLVGRIDKAREMAAKLDQLTAQGEQVGARLRASQPAPPPRRPPIDPDVMIDAETAAENLVLRLSRHDAAPPQAPLRMEPSPLMESRPARRTEERPSARIEPLPSRPLPARRSRVAIDDDLFDAPAPRGRVLPGGRS